MWLRERNITVISHNEYYNVRKEYRNIVKEYVIMKDTYATVDGVWNVYTKNSTSNWCKRRKLA